VAESHGRLDILVNNAPAGAIVPLGQTTMELWRETFRVNCEAVFLSTQIAFELMARTGGGAVINIASIAGQRAQMGFSCYGAAKAALTQFSSIAALEGAAINVRVNVVVPGVIDTPALAPILADPNLRAAVAAGIPVKRLGRPEELANAILFLASDEASYITGQALTVDGGKANQMT
jgi:NAD(P)-dependent dehydrogenase (short-subunit alcohol dehydrogenase family)